MSNEVVSRSSRMEIPQLSVLFSVAHLRFHLPDFVRVYSTGRTSGLPCKGRYDTPRGMDALELLARPSLFWSVAMGPKMIKTNCTHTISCFRDVSTAFGA